MICLSLAALLSIWLKVSKQRMNRYGDKGSPCLMPRVRVMLGCGIPLNRIEYETIVTHLRIRSIHLLWKSHSFHHHFNKTSFQPILGFAQIHLKGHIAILSFHFTLHSVQNFKCYNDIVCYKPPWTNAFWVGDMMWGKIFFSLLANTFAITLYITLHKLIGSKLCNIFRTFCFWY